MVIRRLRFGNEGWYRAVTPEREHSPRQLLGSSRSLDRVAHFAYKRFMHTRPGNTGPVNGEVGGGAENPPRKCS